MDSQARKKLVIPLLTGLAVLMFGFGFALVPLYDLLCDALGINGKTDQVAMLYDPESVTVDRSRSVSLRLVVVNNEKMLWRMESAKRKLSVHPGQVYQLSYSIENPTDHAMVAQAVPSVTPSSGAQYVKKIQCFCFDSMRLESKEQTEVKVVFYIDPELPSDIESLALSYTLFDVTDTVAVN